MLGEIFQGFVEESPISVMVRGTLERMLGAEALDAWYEQAADKQYTRKLLFSTVFDLMHQVVFCIKPSLHAAYQGRKGGVGASIVAVYDKLQGIETTTSAELVRYSARALAPAVEQLQGAREPWLAGYPIKIIDGNCIEATEHRLKPLRGLSAGALPGKSLVVFDPALGLVTDAFPCEDGHAQERALLGEVLPTIQAGELWLHDRNFCTREFLSGHVAREAFFISRQHQKLPFEPLTAWRSSSARIETGKVTEQKVRVIDTEGQAHTFRRIRLELDEPTRDGERVVYLLTNLPRKAASTKTIARLYRRRWSIETAFQELEGHLHSEINTLGYPQAALFGFCVALVAYNALAIVWAALRAVHGEKTIEEQVSGYYIANEIAETHRGMMIAIPAAHWQVFCTMSHVAFVETLRHLAGKVYLPAFRKHPRGPKKPPPKRQGSKDQPHVSTARLLKSNAP